MEKIGLSQTHEWIMSALLSLMKKKNYRDITIVDIVSEAHIGRRTFYRYFKHKEDVLLLYCNVIIQDFAEIIRSKKEITLYSVTLSYFEFWNRNIEFHKLLQKSDMLYFVGDRLPEFLVKVAVMTEHVPSDQKALTQLPKDIYYYAHYFNMGGYWSITTLWLSEDQRKSPEEMAKMLADIILRKY